MIWRDGASYAGDGSRNEQHWCYGQPLFAPAAGTVVTAMDQYPDGIPVAVPMDQSMHPAGNHVVIEVTEGEYLLIAHLLPGSVAVAEGQVVEAGDKIGLTGNSGNSSAPHIHIHLQSGPDMMDPETIGLLLAFDNILVNGEPVDRAELVQGKIFEQA